ncbi:MAG: bifunctional 5,10-methylenetetrahydrofolate dehydrogenase/5,10-methenyltetrahydrofolate cyclohydrolase [Bacteroidetes bacterium]|nr:bifunctional 5,10-methylenetetrahydrofolate dehydrogenase/5,10-methenyltetrahydrofolate cyclohydrolase [Bacteroidota bacterium]
MEILDGKATSAAIKADLKVKVNEMVNAGHKAPHLVAILVGENPASKAYVGNKIKFCQEVGYRSTLLTFNADITEDQLHKEIHKLNNDPEVDGYIVQLPLPKHISEDKILEIVNPEKDVDGFHPVNVGKMVSGLPSYLPATPYGITKIMEHYGISAEGKFVVILGRSHIVGRPMSILLSQSRPYGNGTVVVCHSRTKNLEELTRKADILVAAIGIPQFVKAEMVKDGAVIIDVGINRIDDTTRTRGWRLVGDVDFDAVSEKASYITPVPGGVGPMTIAGLMLNCYHAAQKRV